MNQIHLPDRLPPQSLDAEQACLGASMISKTAAVTLLDELTPEDFYLDAHRRIYEAVRFLLEWDKPVDVLTVPEELRSRSLLDQIGGVAYINTLAESVPTAAHQLHYCRSVREKSILRAVIDLCGDGIGEAYDIPENIPEFLAKIQRAVLRLTVKNQTRTMKPMREIVITTLDELDRLSSKDPARDLITGVATGYRRFDRLTQGFQRGTFSVFAGRPSMGKSALAFGMAFGAATDPAAGLIENGVWRPARVGIFSLEMPERDVALRLVCSEARVQLKDVRKGLAQPDLGITDDGAWTRLGRAIGGLGDAPIFLNDDPDLTIAEIRSLSRRLHHDEDGVDLIVVDYLQLIRAGLRMENRNQEVSFICRELKALARELDCAVVALSQVSREVEKRTDKRPQLADLRESGSIEAEADLVGFLFRKAYYDKKAGSEDEEWETNGSDTEDAEVIIAKHRNGATRTIHMAFTARLARFDDYDTLEGDGGPGAPPPPTDTRPGYAR